MTMKLSGIGANPYKGKWQGRIEFDIDGNGKSLTLVNDGFPVREQRIEAITDALRHCLALGFTTRETQEAIG